MPKQARLLLIDGHSMMYRALFTPGPSLTSPVTDEETSGVLVYVRTLLKVVRRFKPKYVCVACDSSTGLLVRKQWDPNYKANRKKKLEDSDIGQLGRMEELTDFMGFTIVRDVQWEADDVIATIANKCGKSIAVTIVSRDKDLHQLVRDGRVSMFDPMTSETIDEAAVRERWGVSPRKVVEVQTLQGDSTDGVPGVPGIGPKIATQLIQEYGSAREVQRHADDLTPARRKAMLAADIAHCRRMVELNKGLELDVTLRDFRWNGVVWDNALPTIRTLGLRSLEPRKTKR